MSGGILPTAQVERTRTIQYLERTASAYAATGKHAEARVLNEAVDALKRGRHDATPRTKVNR